MTRRRTESPPASGRPPGPRGKTSASLTRPPDGGNGYAPSERALIARLQTPLAVERWLRTLRYNKEESGETLRTLRGVLMHGEAHCLEGALAAAAILEARGYPPLILDIESKDLLDHGVFVYRGPRGWGSVATSRFPGLRGRKPVYRSVRDLAGSYADPFFDWTGWVEGYGILDLRELPPRINWRRSDRNVWAVQEALIDLPHRPLRVGRARERRWRAFYRTWKRSNPEAEPPARVYPGHSRWI